MPSVALTPALQSEYAALFTTCDVKPQRAPEVDRAVDVMVANRARYESVQADTGVPWHVIALIHCMEGGQRFDRHLHNGDPLSARTVQVPAGRPKTGTPPFTWEESAQDALKLE